MLKFFILCMSYTLLAIIIMVSLGNAWYIFITLIPCVSFREFDSEEEQE